MTTAPVIEIPIDDSQFERFAKAFEEYRGHLKTMPADWQAINQKIVEFAKFQRASGASADVSWKNATAAATAYEKAVHSAARAQGALAQSTHSAGAGMRRMAAEGKALAGHMFSAVRYAAKFATFGLGAGLLGAGGLLWGIDDLAHGVLATQRQARGMGLTRGQLNSWRLHMARGAGMPVLSGAAEAQVAPAQAPGLSVRGIDPRRAARESASALAGQEVMAAHQAWRQFPSVYNPRVMALQHLGMPLADIRASSASHAATLRGDIAASGRDAAALGLSNQAQREWSQFSIQLHKAGLLIENALINTLTPLTPKLGELSAKVATFITGLEQSGKVKEWIDDLAGGIKSFADWIGSPPFQQDMRTMAYYFGKIAGGAGRTARYLFGPMPAAPGENNPFNIGGAKHLVGFQSQTEGVQKAFRLLETYPAKYHTHTVAQALAEFKGPWAGPGDMTTAKYIAMIASGAGVSPNAPMPFTDTKKMAAIMHWQSVAEGHPVPEATILADIRKIGVKSTYALMQQSAVGAGYMPVTPEAAALAAAAARHRMAAEAEAAQQPAPVAPRVPGVTHVLRQIQKRNAPAHVHVTIRNQTGAQVHMSTNAAAP